MSEIPWDTLCGPQTPNTLKLAVGGKRAWGFTRVSLSQLTEMCRRCKGTITISSPYIYVEKAKEEMFPTSPEEDAEGDGETSFPTRRFELNHIVRRKMKQSLSDGQIERARQIFAHFDYVPQTKITFRASSPYGNTRSFLLNVRVMGSQIINDTFVGLSKLDFVRSCMISLNGTTATLRITVKGSKSR